jgi:hypothetical protein
VLSLQTLAYLPLEVFLVVVLIERLLAYREKLPLMEKLNMVAGGSFSEVGNNLVRNLHDYFGEDESSHRLWRGDHTSCDTINIKNK